MYEHVKNLSQRQPFGETSGLGRKNYDQRNVLTPHEYLSSFNLWLRTDMPRLNRQILKREEEPDKLKSQVQLYVAAFPGTETITPEQQRLSLQYLGFAISSLERHSQERGAQAGQALATLDGAEPILIELGKQTGHSPRDSLYTFCLWNRGPNSITFSGDPQETLFIDVVNNSIDQLEQAGDRVRPLARGAMAMNDPRSTEIMVEAEHTIDAARQQFLRFLAKDPTTNESALTPTFFRNVLRQYNCTWIIGGEEWGPPTAANAVDQMQLDFIMGTVDAKYEAHLRERFKYFTIDDQVALNADMQEPSILDVIRRTLHVTVPQLETLPQQELADILRKQPEQTREFIGQYVRLADKIGTLSALHWTLVSNYFIKPNKAENEQRRGAVDNTKGGSGMEFPEVKQIRDMRRENPNVKQLRQGLQMV